MTVIQKVVARGFKSFAKHTELVFGNGFNSIIGPNGAGKSNVADSICFVLGKTSAKSLRAEKSANLIYNGGKNNPPSKEAEVSIFFDNSRKTFPLQDKIVKITRLLKKNGQSVYKINDEVRTRQQVIDLLNLAKIDPDGHNIILQGDIIRFTEMKPEERRLLLEEVSGISIYEDKKKKALLELEKVDEKLKEVEIILTERETNLKELKKDRDQALKYNELKDKIKDNKATLISLNKSQKESKKNDIENKLKEHSVKIEEIQNKINNIKDEINNKKEEIKKINLEIEKKGEKEQIVIHKQIEDLKTDLVKINSRIDVVKNEINKIDERKGQLKLSINDVNFRINELKKKKIEIQDKINSSQKEEQKILDEIKSINDKLGIKETNISISEVDTKVESLRSELVKVHHEKNELLREKDKKDYILKSIEEKISKLTSLKESDEKNSFKKLQQDSKKITVELSKALANDSAFSAQLGKARSNLYEFNEELTRLKIKSNSAKEIINIDNSVKKILSLKNQIKGIYGTINELGAVSSKYGLALEVSAGARLKSIVVDSDEVAAECIKLLKESKTGIATFLPLNRIKPLGLPELPKVDGVIGLAIDLIKFDPKFKDIFAYVFGSTIVVNNIDIARRIGINRFRMVTLDGDLFELSGAMVGGFRRKETFGFKEKESIQRISQLEKDIEHLTNGIKIIERNKTENENKINELRQEKSSIEAELIKLERTLSIEDIESYKNEKNDLIKELKEIQIKLQEIDKKIKIKEFEITGLTKERERVLKILDKKSPEISKKLKILDEEYQKISHYILENKSEIKLTEIQINSILLPEIEKINKIIKDSDKEREAFKNELNNLLEMIKNKNNELKIGEVKEKEFYGSFKALSVKRNKLQEEITQKEIILSKEDERTKFLSDKVNEINIDRAKVIAELEALNKSFEEFIDAKIRKNISANELQLELKEFEKLMQNLGNVNLRALEIYEQLEKDYNELVEKKTKLAVEKDDIVNLISEVELKKKEVFMKTFDELNNNFKKIFSSLSTKGEAYLEIENQEDPLNSGVDISVRITGNKFLDIKSLSGGEKTLAALGFIFAIQEYQPASFYLLDEVDAALDKQNSELLSKLIDKYSKNAQYIVITHNDALVSEADHIYGVSMQNSISKVLSLKV